MVTTSTFYCFGLARMSELHPVHETKILGSYLQANIARDERRKCPILIALLSFEDSLGLYLARSQE